MKKILRTLRTLDMGAARRLFAVLEKKPIIEISQSGWAGGRPQVHVGLLSRGGMTSVMTKTDDDAGNAHCSMHAQTLSHITGLRVVDRRPVAKNEGGSGLGKDWIVLPRDAAPTPKPPTFAQRVRALLPVAPIAA